MTALAVVLVAIGGGVGAAGRLALDGLVKGRARTPLPVGTVLINVSGSLLLGLLTGLASAGVLSALTLAVLGTGMMGGYTTFSTASVETVQLVRAGRPGLAVLNGFGMLVVSVAAAALGLWLGRIA